MENISTDNPVVCLLTIHFKNIQLLDNNSDFNEVYDQLRVKASICNEVTYIKMKEFSNLDSIYHYHIQLPDDSNNILTIQLILKSPLVPDYDSILGESCIHIHQIAMESPFQATCTLTRDQQTIAQLSLDCSLNYGIFGYGESKQLHSSHGEEHLQWSTFPRLTPPINQSDSQGLRIIPNGGIKHPAFIPFQQKGTRTGNRQLYPQSVKTITTNMTNLQRWRLQCSVIRDRSKKLEFLEQLLKNPSQNKPLKFEPGITSRSIQY